MKLALIQMAVCHDKDKNLETAVENITKAKNLGADIAILPEMFNCPYSNDYFADYAEAAGEKTYNALSQAAAENDIYLVGGSFPERDGDKIYNTSFVFDRNGTKIARHRKAHLFDIDVKGGQCFFESETFSRGENITVFDTEFGKIGLCICFDMRFPELCRCMAFKGAEMVIVPAAFNMTTGPAHWETMFRQRAVDNQLFTVGVAPARDVNGCYVSYGNSIACDPWGKVICRADEKEALLTVNVDFETVSDIRAQLPLHSALRYELYSEDILRKIGKK